MNETRIALFKGVVLKELMILVYFIIVDVDIRDIISTKMKKMSAVIHMVGRI